MKVAAITGASGGLGSVLAETFARAKYSLILAGNKNLEKLSNLARKLEVFNIKTLVKELDVTNLKSVKTFFESGVKEIGSPDVLINNAGICIDKMFSNMTSEEWDEVINVDLKGIFNCSKEVISMMMNKGGGHIINIGSMTGIVGRQGQANYAAAKAALIGFSKSLALEVGRKNIKVNVVIPGFMETPMTENLPEKILTANIKRSCLGRITFPHDVARMILSLAETESISGQVIICDSRIIEFPMEE